MTDRDPRTPQPGTNQPEPPDNSQTRPAPGGVGTGTENDPASVPAAQPGRSEPPSRDDSTR